MPLANIMSARKRASLPNSTAHSNDESEPLIGTSRPPSERHERQQHNQAQNQHHQQLARPPLQHAETIGEGASDGARRLASNAQRHGVARKRSLPAANVNDDKTRATASAHGRGCGGSGTVLAASSACCRPDYSRFPTETKVIIPLQRTNTNTADIGPQIQQQQQLHKTIIDADIEPHRGDSRFALSGQDITTTPSAAVTGAPIGCCNAIRQDKSSGVRKDAYASLTNAFFNHDNSVEAENRLIKRQSSESSYPFEHSDCSQQQLQPVLGANNSLTLHSCDSSSISSDILDGSGDRRRRNGSSSGLGSSCGTPARHASSIKSRRLPGKLTSTNRAMSLPEVKQQQQHAPNDGVAALRGNIAPPALSSQWSGCNSNGMMPLPPPPYPPPPYPASPPQPIEAKHVLIAPPQSKSNVKSPTSTLSATTMPNEKEDISAGMKHLTLPQASQQSSIAPPMITITISEEGGESPSQRNMLNVDNNNKSNAFKEYDRDGKGGDKGSSSSGAPAHTESIEKIFRGNETVLFGKNKDDMITPPIKESMEFGNTLKTPPMSATDYLKDQIISFFQPSDNKLAMKLFGNKNALDREKLRQKEAGNWVIHPCSNFR